MNKLIVFSGIQPSGELNIGHYISVLSQWKKIQYDFNCFYCIADLHAITNNNFSLIKKNVFHILSILLSIGIDPNKNTIFLQSDIIEHLQLFWILLSFVRYGEMKRMHQFKKSILNNKNINIGSFTYPILMASDILLYNTNLVSIGYDQIQHIELVKKISIRFNNKYDNIFTIPNKFCINDKYCIMSLLDPKKKMSKSDKNLYNYISLLDSDNIIEKKINKSITDMDFPPIIKYDYIKKPGISNLLNIASNLDNISINDLENEFINKNYYQFKKYIINILTKKLSVIQKKYYKIRNNELLLNKILFNGYNKSKYFAKNMMDKVNKLFYK